MPMIDHIQLADVPDRHEPALEKSAGITSSGVSTSSAIGARSAASITRSGTPSRGSPGESNMGFGLPAQNRMPVSNKKRVCVVLLPSRPKTSPGVVLLVPTWEISARAKKILY
jgi:hypothetical protein